MNWKYSDDRKTIILEEQPKRFKYITGTRFASILGLNPYSTPFQIWCECTRLVTPPFEETIYTKAGKIIEPIQREYISTKFPNIFGPEEYFGNIFEDVRWNFFGTSHNPFQGCWDAVSTKNNKKDIVMVVEFKTASNALNWVNNEPPIYYTLQGALYAKLLGLGKVLFVVSFLNQMDYAHPEDFKPNETNTKMIVKKLDEIFVDIGNGEVLNIDGLMDKVKDIWENNIKTGTSPEFDEVKDKEYLDIIRKSQPSNDNELEDVCESAIALVKEIELLKVSSGIKAKEKKLKLLETDIKSRMMEKELYNCGAYTLSAKNDKKFNEKEFAKEQPTLYNKYSEDVVTYKLTKKVEEENE
jgi:predicted phage-related endonuclease